jgi:hypothetical protein
MQKRHLSPIFAAALRPRWPLWAVPLTIGLIAVVVSFCFATEKETHYNELFMAVGGWLLTLAGVLFAGNQAARISLADAFSKLHEQESSKDQYYAKKTVFAFGRRVLSTSNRYRATREITDLYPPKKLRELHEARRRLKHYWLLAEAYFESHLMTASEVFAVAGSPEILLSLEPLEVLAAEESEFPMKLGTWTSLKLLKEWYRIQDMKKEQKSASLNLPMDPVLYDTSLSKRKRTA